MIYALVHYPNIDTTHIDQLRGKYDPLVKLIEPHITLMFPVPESIGEDKLVDHIQSVLRGWHSFPIHLKGLQISFDSYLFLLIREGNPNLIRLHNELYTGILADHRNKDMPFVPHLTLGVLGEDASEHTRALEVAKQFGIDEYCELTQLHLVKVNDDRSKIVGSKRFSLAR